MLKRDFTKSSKEYFKQNKIALISVAVFLVVGILLFAILGMNGNFELKGYNEFTITVSESSKEEFSTYRQDIGKIINSYNGKFDTLSIAGEGDETKFIVRYLNDVNEADVLEINKLVAEKLNVSVEKISSHEFVKPIVKNSDYVYTAVAILLIVVVASIFAYARYNGASSIAVMLACLLGTLGFISINAILRLSIGMSFFAMLTILNMLIVYFAINLFETMHKSSWLMSGDYATAMETSLKSSKNRMVIVSVAVMLIGILFILLGASAIKYVSVNIMFMAVTILAVGWYVIPFVWNVFIPYCRKREYKIKTTEVEKKK